MQIRKTYKGINPELLYNELKDSVLRQETVISEEKLETYSMPDDSSSFISRGTLAFKCGESAKKGCLRAHLVGSAKTETKLMLDINEELFSPEKVSAVQEDLDFVFGSYEVKPR